MATIIPTISRTRSVPWVGETHENGIGTYLGRFLVR